MRICLWHSLTAKSFAGLWVWHLWHLLLCPHMWIGSDKDRSSWERLGVKGIFFQNRFTSRLPVFPSHWGCHSQLQVGLRLWLSLMTWSDELDEHDEQNAQNDGLAADSNFSHSEFSLTSGKAKLPAPTTMSAFSGNVMLNSKMLKKDSPRDGIAHDQWVFCTNLQVSWAWLDFGSKFSVPVENEGDSDKRTCCCIHLVLLLLHAGKVLKVKSCERLERKCGKHSVEFNRTFSRRPLVIRRLESCSNQYQSVSVTHLYTAWRQTIECYRSARSHWTAGKHDINIVSILVPDTSSLKWLFQLITPNHYMKIGVSPNIH